jgi:hypothetical protein
MALATVTKLYCRHGFEQDEAGTLEKLSLKRFEVAAAVD